MIRRGSLILSLTLPPMAAAANPIPPSVEAMIRAADRGGDPTKIEVTVDMAKKAFPASGKEIDALAKGLRAASDRRHRAKLSRQGFFQGWKGQGQVGAGTTTGNSKSTTLSVGLAFNREGLKWNHAVTGTIDYQRDFGRESKGRYFTDYQGNYRFSDRIFALGVLSFEDNRFSGFSRRYSESVGFGWRIIVSQGMNLSVEAGPALRQTDFVAQSSESALAGRAAMNFDWQVLSNLKLTQAASFYGERRDSTFTSNTALTANLIGSLSAQLSYLAQFESSPPQGLERFNTTSRLTLVYSF
jgi:putative salt-induced outer membrane protein